MSSSEPELSIPLEYKILYSKRKTIELRFENVNLLLIKAPKNTSPKHIADVLTNKTDWIRKTRLKLIQRWPVPKMMAGEKILLLGEWRELEINPVGHKKISLSGSGKIVISKDLAMQGAQALVPFYRQITRHWVHHFADLYSSKWQLTYKSIRINSAKTRWGSCGARNTLNFSWRLAMTPLLSIEYVVAHELAHIKHHNHSLSFWQFLEQMMPHYKQGQAWLKENGNKLPQI